MIAFARFTCVLIALCGTAPAAAAAGSSPLLQPTGKWTVEFADAMCVAWREYGTPAKPMTLLFKPSPLAREMRLLIVRGGTSAFPVHHPATVVFGNGAPVKSSLTTYSPKGQALRIHSIQFKDDDVAALRQSATVTVASKGEVDASFALRGMAGAMSVLDDCVSNLIQQWGISRDEQKRMKTYPQSVKPLGEYVSSKDYPARALRDSVSGRTSIKLMIDSTGAITDCTVVEPSGSGILDETSCRIVRARVRYRPAMDHDGKPMNSLVVNSINWVTD